MELNLTGQKERVRDLVGDLLGKEDLRRESAVAMAIVNKFEIVGGF